MIDTISTSLEITAGYYLVDIAKNGDRTVYSVVDLGEDTLDLCPIHGKDANCCLRWKKVRKSSFENVLVDPNKETMTSVGLMNDADIREFDILRSII